MCNFIFSETLSGVKPTSSVSHQCGSAHSSRGLWLSAEEARVPPHRSECGFCNFPQVLFSADCWCLSAMPIWAFWLNICCSCHCACGVWHRDDSEGALLSTPSKKDLERQGGLNLRDVKAYSWNLTQLPEYCPALKMVHCNYPDCGLFSDCNDGG